MIRRPLAALVHFAVLALAPVSPLVAQGSPFLPQLSPGVRVRIDAPGVLAGRLATTVVSRTRDSVKVLARPRKALAKDEEPLTYLTLALDRITSVEVSDGRSHVGGTVVGALSGAAVGVALVNVDALVGADKNAQAACQRPADCEGVPTYQAAVIGAAIGAVAGSLFRREQWKRVDFAPRASLERGVTGGTVAVHLRF
jgi:hypothetical protein